MTDLSMASCSSITGGRPAMTLRLYPYQKTALQWLSTRNHAILALEQGLGKTVVAAVDAKPPILVVCTKAMKYVWKREFNIWRPKLKVHIIRDIRDPIDHKADVIVVNFDIVWKLKCIDRLSRRKTLICDESHYIKTPSASRTKTVVYWAMKMPFVRFLSGTPVISRPAEFFTQLYALRALPNGFGWRKYIYKFCAPFYDDMNELNVRGHSNLDELHELADPVMLRMLKESVMPDLPPKTYRLIELDLPVPSLEKGLTLNDVEAPDNKIPFEALSEIRKENALRKLPLALEHIKSSLDQNPEKKIVLFAHHRIIVEALHEALADYGAVKLYGGTSSEDADAAVHAFQTDPKCRIFVGNIQSAGEGITLTAASHVIFVEPGWTPKDLAQPSDRCHRIGQLNAVLVEVLVIRRSIDAQVLRGVIQKIDVVGQIVKETNMKSNSPNLRVALVALANAFVDVLEASNGGSVETDIAAEVETGNREAAEDKAAKAAEDKAAKAAMRKEKKVAEEEAKALAAEAEEKAKAQASEAEAKPETDGAKTLTIETLRPLVAAMVAGGNRQVVLDTLDIFDAKSLSTLKPEDYAAFADAIS